MNFKETVDFLYSKLPYFTRDGKAAYKIDLNNTILLCELLNFPQNNFKCIHVAGTNGKGSVSNMLSAILQNHGYKTGLYTSPHLKDFRERIRINGEMITEDFVIQFVSQIEPHLARIQPSFFEITVAMCFQWFEVQKVDFAIIETGLGGRLDSTNVIQPLLSIITNIGMDHADLLGDTLEQIAAEKAGIIKPNTPVVIGESDPLLDSIFIQKAKECQANIFFADTNPNYYNTEIDSDLKGEYQQKNIVTVMQACDVLKTLGLELNPYKIASALQNVKKLTQFSGRWEILGYKPQIIADSGHNSHGLKIVFNQLSKQKYNKLHIVFGMVKDKDRKEILQLLPKNASYYFTKPNLERALSEQILKEECAAIGRFGDAYSSVKEAFEAAKKNAAIDDLIFIGGSTFVVAEVI